MKQLYVIRDNIAEEYGPVYEAKNEDVAKRNFRQMCEKAVYPEDLSLYRLAFWNDEVGEIQCPQTLLIEDGRPRERQSIPNTMEVVK